MRCYIFDLDGTVCDIEHRLHFIKAPITPLPGNPDAQVTIAPIGWRPDWDSFYAACVGDKPIVAICRLLTHLARVAPVVFVSGRSDAVRSQTVRWLADHVLPTSVLVDGIKLYMRKDGDHRPDHEVKSEMLDMLLADGYEPIIAFEGRKQVVEMWRSRGIVCAQVAEGNF